MLMFTGFWNIANILPVFTRRAFQPRGAERLKKSLFFTARARLQA
jgi:hypothetical protein